LAKGASRLFVLTETIANVVHAGLIWSGLMLFGIEGTAIAFFALYIFHTLLMLIVSRRLIGYSWSRGVLKLIAVMLPVVVGTFFSGKLLPSRPALLVGLAATALTSIFCLHGLTHRLGAEHKICCLVRKMPFLNLMVPKTQHAL
jgi:enterobacterial common antigen flippase